MKGLLDVFYDSLHCYAAVVFTHTHTHTHAHTHTHTHTFPHKKQFQMTQTASNVCEE